MAQAPDLIVQLFRHHLVVVATARNRVVLLRRDLQVRVQKDTKLIRCVKESTRLPDSTYRNILFQRFLWLARACLGKWSVFSTKRRAEMMFPAPPQIRSILKFASLAD